MGASLLDNVYATPYEQGMEQSVGARLTAIQPPEPWDQASIRLAPLAFLAETLDSITYDHASPAAQKRAAIQDALYMHIYHGTPAALRRFASRFGVTITWTFNSPHFDVRIEDVASYTGWADYVQEVVTQLLPYWVTRSFTVRVTII